MRCRSGSGFADARRAPSARPGSCVLGSGADPAGDATATCATSWRPRRSEARSRWRTTGTRRTSWRSPGRGRSWPTCPDLPSDNALPRWLAEVGRLRRSRPPTTVAARGRHRRAARPRPHRRRVGRRAAGRLGSAVDHRVRDRLAAVRAVAARPGAPSCSSPGERRRRRWPGWSASTAARTRALIEERGLRDRRVAGPAAARRSRARRAARRDGPGVARDHSGPARRRRDRRHAGCCSPTGSAPTRARWPAAEDRFASDLLLAERDRRSVAAGADRVGRGARRSRSCSAATRSSGPGCGSCRRPPSGRDRGRDAGPAPRPAARTSTRSARTRRSWPGSAPRSRATGR